jgi:hypothetical protein
MRIKLSAVVLVSLTMSFAPAFANASEDRTERECVQVMRTLGKEPVAFVLDQLRDHDLLIFDDALHSAVEPFLFYQQLIRDPEFRRQAKYIFLEALPINQQTAIDAYLAAEREDQTLLYPAFQDDYSGTGFNYKTYFDLLHAIYEVNRQTPKAERLQVVCVSNPVYWSVLKTREDLALFRKSLSGRDALMYEVIRDELDGFRSGRKGIFLTNTRHAYKGIRDRQGRLFWNCATWFHERFPGKAYSLRCHGVVLSIERIRAADSSKPATAEGRERFDYHWARPGRGLWDEAWRELGNKPIAVPISGNVFGKQPYVGNHMLDAAPGQTYGDAYDAILFLAPMEQLRQSAQVGDIYTPAFKIELARRYRLLYTQEQLTKRFQDEGVRTLEELIDKVHVAVPEQPLPQLKGLEPVRPKAKSTN